MGRKKSVPGRGDSVHWGPTLQGSMMKTKDMALFFFKPTCLKKKEWPRWKIRPERRWRPHLAGHVLGWGDRDEYKSIFTGHVETFCRNSLFIVKITLATLGGNDQMGGWAGGSCRQQPEKQRWDAYLGSCFLVSPPPCPPHLPAHYSQAGCHTRDL